MQKLVSYDPCDITLVQTLEVTVHIGKDVPVGLYHVDINLGRVHAYTDELSQAFQGLNGAHRMKEALDLIRFDITRETAKASGSYKTVRTVPLYDAVPKVTITSPSLGTVELYDTYEPTVTVRGTVEDDIARVNKNSAGSRPKVSINDVDLSLAAAQDGLFSFEQQVTLGYGRNLLRVNAENILGNIGYATKYVTLSLPVPPGGGGGGPSKDPVPQPGKLYSLEPFQIAAHFDDVLSETSADTIHATMRNNLQPWDSVTLDLVETGPVTKAFRSSDGVILLRLLNVPGLDPALLETVEVSCQGRMFGRCSCFRTGLIETAPASKTFMSQRVQVTLTPTLPFSATAPNHVAAELYRAFQPIVNAALTETGTGTGVYQNPGGSLTISCLDSVLDPQNEGVCNVSVSCTDLGLSCEPVCVTNSDAANPVFASAAVLFDPPGDGITVNGEPLVEGEDDPNPPPDPDPAFFGRVEFADARFAGTTLPVTVKVIDVKNQEVVWSLDLDLTRTGNVFVSDPILITKSTSKASQALVAAFKVLPLPDSSELQISRRDTSLQRTKDVSNIWLEPGMLSGVSTKLSPEITIQYGHVDDATLSVQIMKVSHEQPSGEDWSVHFVRQETEARYTGGRSLAYGLNRVAISVLDKDNNMVKARASIFIYDPAAAVPSRLETDQARRIFAAQRVVVTEQSRFTPFLQDVTVIRFPHAATDTQISHFLKEERLEMLAFSKHFNTAYLRALDGRSPPSVVLGLRNREIALSFGLDSGRGGYNPGAYVGSDADSFSSIVFGGLWQGAKGLVIGTYSGVKGVVRCVLIEPLAVLTDGCAVGYVAKFEPELAPYLEKNSLILRGIEQQGLGGFTYSVADNLVQTVTLHNFARAIGNTYETGNSEAIAEEYVNLAALLLPAKIQGVPVNLPCPRFSLAGGACYRVTATGACALQLPIRTVVQVAVTVEGKVVKVPAGALLMVAGAGGAGGPGGAPPQAEPPTVPEPMPRPSGKMVEVKRKWPDSDLEYQAQITGEPIRRSGTDKFIREYKVDEVYYDGIKKGDAECWKLLEAKADHTQFVDPATGRFRLWWTGKKGALDEIERQVRNAKGAPIEWHYEFAEARDAFKLLFLEEGSPIVKRALQEGQVRFVHTPRRS
jgi:hypothetical protein